jgi:hypothetical protein
MQVLGVIASVGHEQHWSNSNQMARGHGVVNSLEAWSVGCWLELVDFFVVGGGGESGGGEASNKG